MTLGRKITKIRKEKKLSQVYIASYVGVSRDAISKYERDDIVPSVENAKMIAKVLGVSLDYLVSEVDSLEVVDVDMLNRMHEIQRLSEDDKTTVIKIIDAFIRDTKTKRPTHKKPPGGGLKLFILF
ncbi:helix-turn-helix transcriptional regulator [Galbibacter sp. BG1]|uniref:helix-turn-helix domain-containing protein n=1 Tax=Galbibacter sp. BG1 TaxID=1170699 RepID=UPI0015BEA74E|nr:helix-turn-helix transcriptional regulator [Galbibacter sp. BG1]QLE02060.1 helix-turn-helix transcriptional regulator [Galbibacter sp. BG1]